MSDLTSMFKPNFGTGPGGSYERSIGQTELREQGRVPAGGAQTLAQKRAIAARKAIEVSALFRRNEDE